jgi:uncharacterized UBP type Zn finger protein
MPCEHFAEARHVESRSAAFAKGCEECKKIGSYWVHLRECLICGNVACCDQSPNMHATKHFYATRHPVMRSVQPGERWGWCYVDGDMVESI